MFHLDAAAFEPTLRAYVIYSIAIVVELAALRALRRQGGRRLLDLARDLWQATGWRDGLRRLVQVPRAPEPSSLPHDVRRVA